MGTSNSLLPPFKLREEARGAFLIRHQNRRTLHSQNRRSSPFQASLALPPGHAGKSERGNTRVLSPLGGLRTASCRSDSSENWMLASGDAAVSAYNLSRGTQSATAHTVKKTSTLIAT